MDKDDLQAQTQGESGDKDQRQGDTRQNGFQFFEVHLFTPYVRLKEFKKNNNF